ncbi:hypothetical protein [Methylobacterium sp. Leaf118]|uniref:hypothetical protein n=1 Tax=Methylobacterium sp. Leaf118 TaxID=2876562 RepID=UPI001E556905|nr:hypothetical protein [Methylobacterium sp. Leaf118]
MPTTRRDRTGRAPRALRALAGVAALYALVLQALLGGIAALPVAGVPGLLCLQMSAGPDDAHDGRAPFAALPHAGCCTAASHAPTAAPPAPAAGPVHRAERTAQPASWAPGRTGVARTPPHTLASARAPPVA